MLTLSNATKRLLQPISVNERTRLGVTLSEDGSYFILSFYEERLGNRTWPTGQLDRFLSRFPERKKLDGSRYPEYLVGATDFSAVLIDQLWPKEQLDIDDEAKLMLNFLMANVRQSENAALNVAAYKDNGSLPDDDYEIHSEHPLSPYQRLALHNMMKLPGYALFMEQGTGKTAVAIAALCNLAARKKGGRFRALIVAPKNVRLNWHKEIAKFATRKIRSRVLRGGALDRVKIILDALSFAGDEDAAVVICSYESVERSWGVIKEIDWDMCVLDESHYIKSTYAQRGKRALQLREICDRRYVLTGTPITNHLIDLYNQLEFIGNGASGFRSWRAFKRFHAVTVETASGFDKIVGAQNVPFMQERLARLAFIIRKDEALPDLPDKVYDIEEVEMSKRQSDYYDQICEKLMIEIDEELSKDEDDRSLTINNILTKLLRLAQITSGFVKWDEVWSDEGELIRPAAIEAIDPNPKVERLLEILKEKGPNEKTIVWACWKQDIQSIQEAIEAAGIRCVSFYGGTSDNDRIEAERAFNEDDDCKVFIGNPAAGGVGLNLLGYPPGRGDEYETNCDHVIYFSQNWSMTHRLQSEDRAHRRGARNNVRITDLCCPGTIDEEIRARVTEKKINALTVQDLREVLKGLRR